MQERLLAGSLLALAAGALYAYVGYRIGRRRVLPGSQLPLVAFATWWHTLAATTGLGGAAGVLAAFGLMDADLYVALTYAFLFLLALGLAAVLYYLLYVFTGQTWWWRPLVPAYFAYAVFLVYFIRSHLPTSIDTSGWNVRLLYETPLQEDPLFAWVIGLFAIPQMATALAYGSLLSRTTDRTLRYRIGMVSGGLLVWFGSSLISLALAQDASALLGRLVGLAAASAILAAYHPPRLMRRRFGLVSIDEPLPG